MEKIFLSLVSVSFLLCINGCSIICEEGQGTFETEQRTPGEFKEISLDIPADVTVVRGDAHLVTLEAEENLLGNIELSLKGKILSIGADPCINPTKKVRIRITLPELDQLEVNGSGNIIVPDTFQVKNIKLQINGSGDINAKLIAAKIESEINGSGNVELGGSANTHEIDIRGSGNVKASALPSNSTDISVNGSGDVFAYTIQDLDVHINGSGSVHYRGKPSVSTKINGSGKVVDEN